MAEKNGGPHLAAAFLCERVLMETDGVASYIRVIDRLTYTVTGGDVPDQMPTHTVRPTAVIVLKGGSARGRDAVVLTVEKPSGLRHELGALPVVLEPEDRGVALNLELAWEVDEEGLYWIDVVLKRSGRQLTRIPFRIIYAPLSAPQP